MEAARAGEQGRGFAVVASEVRSLAQRSAEAAREIKTLIGASVERVEGGSRLVQDAGKTMGEIVASVQRVTDIIGEISAAAAEQSAGLGHVNGAVTQLDQMTQQNAALVEESAAAAASLKEQSHQLALTLSTFRLGQQDIAAAPPPKQDTVAVAPPKVVAHAVIQQVRSRATSPAPKPKVALRPTPAPVSALHPAAPVAAPAGSQDSDWETF